MVVEALMDLPLETLAYRLPMLLDAAKHAETLKKSQLKLPVQIIASSEDKVLPSVDEGRKLARALPNAKLTTLEGSGHVPLLEARVNLATILRDAKLLERKPLGRPKDYVTDFTLPTAEQFANASKSLSTIRKLTSPIFLSTKSDGRRVSGHPADRAAGAARPPTQSCACAGVHPCDERGRFGKSGASTISIHMNKSRIHCTRAPHGKKWRR